MRGHALLFLAAATAFALCLQTGASASIAYGGNGNHQTQPFHGQGGYPSKARTVYVSAMLQRLIAVDDKNYRFETLIYLHLSWTDPEAERKVMQATDRFRNSTEEECDRPCASDFTLSKRQGQGYGTHVTCCDDLWLPTVRMINVYSLPDTRLQPYEISVEGDSVSWWLGLNSVVFTPMNFRSFPFDSQDLVLQFGYSDAAYIKEFVPSTTSKRFLIRGDGNIVSGWDVTDVKVVNSSQTQQQELSDWVEQYGKFSDEDDPSPVVRRNANATKELVTFEVVIQIKRLWKHYVLNLITPAIFIVLLSLITFLIPADSLDVRIGLSVTLFLSLTALQFIINESLPKTSNPSAMHELILISYIIVTFGMPESILVYLVKQQQKEIVEPASADLASNFASKVIRLLRGKRHGAPFIIDWTSFSVCLLTLIIAMVFLFGKD
ncbi:ligand-gated ion-channel protein [Chloropicon roscoffensis]|uniref:Ligand-gated ion-channel protein n=1 Tax=Chloropicon roscoffensis TaxID=1461544 RepID=A0AAX4P3C0_9CHLO